MSEFILPYSTIKRSTKRIKRGKKPRAKLDAKWQETRVELHERAKGRCEHCGKDAPLTGGLGVAGEGAHASRRWKGGKYDLKNLWWSCGGVYGCHQTEHRNEAHGLCPRRPR